MDARAEKVCQGAALLLALLGFFTLVALTNGCRSLFGEHTGANIVAGEHVILPEVSDATDAFAIRIFRTLKGVWFWTGKGYQIDLVYSNCYTNTYFGCVTTRDCMTVKATLVPCETDAETTAATTNAVEEVASTLAIEEMKRLTGQDGDKRNAVAVGDEITMP